MPEANPWSVSRAQVEWSDGTPRDPDCNDIFYSRTGGREESECVFLQGNHLTERWSQLAGHHRGVFVVGETGFGSGLNFLLAQDLFLRTAPPGWQLHYVSVEHRPWTVADLRHAHAQWPVLARGSTALLQQWPSLLRGPHRLHMPGDRVRLTLLFDEALEALSGLQAEVHAWFLDGFAPARNGSIWRPEVLREIRRLSVPGTSFATYTAAAAVREGLRQQGFDVQRKPGFGGKRHRLEGALPGRGFARPHRMPANAAVIGAGFAGVCNAAALARRGIPTTLLDAAPHPAAGASGVPRAVLYLKLSGAYSDIARLQLQALGYAAANALPHAPGASFVQGVLQLGDTAQCERWQNLCGVPASLLQIVDRQTAEEIAGIDLASGGLWFPSAFAEPGAEFCDRMMTAHDIAFHGNREVTDLYSKPDGDWQLHLLNPSEPPVHTGLVISCTGIGNRAPSSLQGLPLRPIRGQLTRFAGATMAERIGCVVTGEGHVIPAANRSFFAGSSYVNGGHSLAPTPQEDQHNLARAADLLNCPPSALQAQDAWVGLRCAGPDHLPAAGPMPGVTGHYILTGLRSRGLLLSPLLAEAIVSEACGEPLPVTNAQWQMLRPARWLDAKAPPIQRPQKS